MEIPSSASSSLTTRLALTNAVASISSQEKMCGTVVHASSMVCAICLRRPRKGSTRDSSACDVGTGAFGFAALAGVDADSAGVTASTDTAAAGARAARRTSSLVICPRLPDGETVAKSTPISLASLRVAGLALGRRAGAVALACAEASTAAVAAELAVGALCCGAVECAGSDPTRALETAPCEAASSVSMAASNAPTGMTSLAWPPWRTSTPATGDGISTIALSVCTSTNSWSALTVSPTSTNHRTTSPSLSPSPTSGRLNS